ncbi:hypothetical protein ABW20_dc0106668 [Dactylellina cionopaga]|nr:hypothetical protein ABW20_dc0106668 [Dactylellina cionopaga]
MLTQAARIVKSLATRFTCESSIARRFARVSQMLVQRSLVTETFAAMVTAVTAAPPSLTEVTLPHTLISKYRIFMPNGFSSNRYRTGAEEVFISVYITTQDDHVHEFVRFDPFIASVCFEMQQHGRWGWKSFAAVAFESSSNVKR